MLTLIVSTPVGTTKDPKPQLNVITTTMVRYTADMTVDGFLWVLNQLEGEMEDVRVILITGEIATYELELFVRLARLLEERGLFHYLFVEEWTLDDDWFSSENPLGGHMVVADRQRTDTDGASALDEIRHGPRRQH